MYSASAILQRSQSCFLYTFIFFYAGRLYKVRVVDLSRSLLGGQTACLWNSEVLQLLRDPTYREGKLPVPDCLNQGQHGRKWGDV